MTLNFPASPTDGQTYTVGGKVYVYSATYNAWKKTSSGETGPQGDTGPQGIQGVAGIQGERGLQGEIGPEGIQGALGLQGSEGAQGQAGIQGAVGLQGELGTQGATGATGPTGPQGPAGATGSTGATGAQGPQGDPGVVAATAPVVYTSGTQTVSLNVGTGLTTTSGNLVPDFGTTSGKVAQGNDSRFTDSRTPTAHKTSHATGGSDALSASDIGAAASTHTHGQSDITNLTTDLSSKIANSLISTSKGALITSTGSAVAALPVGANDKALVADSSTSSGLRWGNPDVPADVRQFTSDGSVLRNLSARTNPAEALLKQAVWWVDSAHSSATGQAVTNLGWGGSALNAQLGSSKSGLTVEPTLGYVYLPGVTGNYLSVPDEAALDITGDIDIRVRASLADWTPAALSTLMAKRNSPDNSWHYYVNTDGTLGFLWYTSTAANTATSSVATGFADGAVKWVRVTLDVNNGASGHDVKFWTSDDGATWTQLGTTQTAAGVTSIDATNAIVEVGSRTAGAAANSTGAFYRAQVYSGIDGTKVLDVDCARAVIDRPQFTAVTGQVVTINDTSRDSNDAKYLDWDGENYVYLPGVASNYMSVPDAANLDITGDIDIRVKVALDDWSPSANNVLLSKYGFGGARSFRLSVSSSLGGVLSWIWSQDGTAAAGLVASTAVTGITDGTIKWVRVTHDVDNGASGNDVRFWTSDDGVTWSQLGSTVTTAGVTSFFSGAAPIEVGIYANATTDPASGKFYRAQVLNGIDGTPVLDIDTSVVASGNATSFTARTGQTVTINRSTSGRKSVAVTHPCWLLGTDDYLEVPDSDLLDFGASDSFTVVIVHRQWNNAIDSALIAKRGILGTNTDAGWVLSTNTQVAGNNRTGVRIADGSNITTSVAAASNGWTNGTINLHAAVIDRSAQQLSLSLNGGTATTTSTASVGSTANGNVVRVGAASPTAGQYAAMEFVAAAIFRRALTATEIAVLSNYYSARIGA